MSKIDLSKAKVGDKFRIRSGFIMTYYECKNHKSTHHLLKDEEGSVFYYHENGKFLLHRDTGYDLVEQVHDKPLDELIQEATKQIKENDDVISEEKELQRRQEVVELADRIFFSERGSSYSFKECIEVAEHSVNMINQYIKEGKL